MRPGDKKLISQPLLAALAVALAGCNAQGPTSGVPGDSDSTQPFAVIEQDDVISLTGTEPFWGGKVDGTVMTYTTMENQDGWTFAVTRFAGRAGIGFTGEVGGEPLMLTVTEGECSDQMSDKAYPFTATLKIGDDVRTGCAWTAQHPFGGPENP